jgi:hypothetical protein
MSSVYSFGVVKLSLKHLVYHLLYKKTNRDSAIARTTDYGRSWNPSEVFLDVVQRPTQALIQWVQRALSPGEKRLGREAANTSN